MACIIKRPDSKSWIACFTDINGRRLKRSTKVLAIERERLKALKIAEQYEEAARKKRTAAQVRRVIADLHSKITGEDLPFQSFRVYLAGWLAEKQGETAPATRTFYSSNAEKFLTFLGDRADKDISEITKKDILDFRRMETARGLAPKTINHSIKFLRMVFNRAWTDDIISDTPAKGVNTLKKSREKARRPFSQDEIRAVLRVADDEWRSMVLFGVFTGQRLGDIACLTWGNVDLQAQEVRLVTRKRGLSVKIPIAGPLAKHIATLSLCKNASSPVHPRAAEIVRLQGKTGGLSNQFAKILAKAGLREKQPHTKTHGLGRGLGSNKETLSFHSLRHTAVSMMKAAGIPEATAMEIVGHESVEMSRLYTHVGDAELRRASESFPDIMAGMPEGEKG
jgi:integrase